MSSVVSTSSRCTAPARSSPASVDRLSHLTGMDRQVWKESKRAKGTHEVSIQKGSEGARGTYLLESTAQPDKSGCGKNPRERALISWRAQPDGQVRTQKESKNPSE